MVIVAELGSLDTYPLLHTFRTKRGAMHFMNVMAKYQMERMKAEGMEASLTWVNKEWVEVADSEESFTQYRIMPVIRHDE